MQRTPITFRRINTCTRDIRGGWVTRRHGQFCWRPKLFTLHMQDRSILSGEASNPSATHGKKLMLCVWTIPHGVVRKKIFWSKPFDNNVSLYFNLSVELKLNITTEIQVYFAYGFYFLMVTIFDRCTVLFNSFSEASGKELLQLGWSVKWICRIPCDPHIQPDPGNFFQAGEPWDLRVCHAWRRGGRKWEKSETHNWIRIF